jgi:hypothetical protein
MSSLSKAIIEDTKNDVALWKERAINYDVRQMALSELTEWGDADWIHFAFFIQQFLDRYLYKNKGYFKAEFKIEVLNSLRG